MNKLLFVAVGFVCRVYNLFQMMFQHFTYPWMATKVYRVLRYSTTNDKDSEEDVTSVYAAGNVPPCTDNQYLEYRVTHKGKSFRVLSFNNDQRDPCVSMFHKKMVNPTRKGRIISAMLRDPVSEISEDVYERVMKFAGPNHDFFGTTPIMKWLFMNDDVHDIDADLVLRLSNGRVLVYKPDDVILM